MNLQIFQGHSPELAQSDVNIVIDVIRAFTVAHHAFLRGVKEILLAGTTNEAFLLKNKYPDYLLAGEIRGLQIAGFDFDNSPKKMAAADIAGRTLVQKTTNGVRATLNALNADAVFVTGYSNARTTAEYVKQIIKEGATINIIASHPDGDDDLACAEYIQSILKGNETLSEEEVVKRILTCQAAKKFFDETQPQFDSEDLSYCIKEIKKEFVMQVFCSGHLPKIVRVNRDELPRFTASGKRMQAKK
ncbi:2-phosphosulfolactate phosphatase [Bacillus sp. M6-12]|uniref:2-phosphosulfolactate phosphatase n=1 Tax=Bacillus sp. M6-12 TaxID=2054166 RepID=UPI000C764BD9|nr:2-phosphosulfolactate phosphatase [Bacillus sp. M6-12]PLS16571.1 2-phosphosulfolactate phosphatase [Bacillus sp. M6-12]